VPGLAPEQHVLRTPPQAMIGRREAFREQRVDLVVDLRAPARPRIHGQMFPFIRAPMVSRR
jgi:hypothetical protein